MDRERDAVDEMLDDLLGTGTPTYDDVGIESLFMDDPEALDAIERTLPVIQGRRVRPAPM